MIYGYDKQTGDILGFQFSGMPVDIFYDLLK